MKAKSINLIQKFVIPVALALFFFIISSSAIAHKSNTTDEASHLVRGIMLLKTRDFRLNQHHPYLFNVINAIPAVLNPKLKTESLESENWKMAKKDEMTVKLVEINGGKGDFSKNILYLPRLVTVFLVSLFLVAFYKITYDSFNFSTAVIATATLALSPTLLAHGALVTTDAPSMITIFFGSWALYKYLKSNEKRNWLIAFILISFTALITKYTAVFVAFLWIAILFHYEIFIAKKGVWSSLLTILAVLVSWFLLLVGAYGFQFKTIRDVEYGNPWFNAATLDYISIVGKIAGHDFTAFLENIYYNLRLPFPQYIKGFIDNVLKHDFFGHKSYLLGEFSSSGWWYYFPVVFAVKETISFVLLTIFSLIYFSVISIKSAFEKRIKYEAELVFAVVPIFLFLLSMQSSLNLGIRHLLPIFPFLAIGIGILGSEMIKKSKSGLRILICFFLISFISVLSQYPNYIEYFNEVAGGPQKGFTIVRDSNFDWGQNDAAANEYVEKNDNVDFDIQNLNEDGQWVVRVEDLFGNPETKSPELKQLYEDYLKDKRKPIGSIYYTFWVFEIKND